MKNLLVRSLSGAVYVALIISSIILNEWFFATVCLLFNILALLEFQRFNTGYKKIDFAQIVGSVVFFILSHFIFIGIIEKKWLFLAVLIPLLTFSVALYKKEVDLFKELSFKLSGYIYITLPLILLNFLNLKLTDNYSYVILLIFALVWANDTFAYLSGMLLGKHRLFERITPKKTWEGFLGGALAVVIISWAVFPYSGFDSLFSWLVLGAVISMVSVFGDFVESMFKRAAGLKDSGNIIPGHGGILDRIDSILFVFPVVFVYFELFL